jgi:hypothetical protein
MKSNKVTLKQLKMDTVSPATRLLDKRRLMYQVQEAFERQKEEEKRREEVFKSKEAELRSRDLAIQEKLIQFNKIIQEYEAKKLRAKNRIDEEKKAIEQKLKKKSELEEKLNELKEKNVRLEKQVRDMKAYEEFLETVRKSNPEEFSDINDIVSLYNILTSTNEKLKIQQKELEEENQRLRGSKDDIGKKKKDEILQLNIQVAQLSKEYEEIDMRRHELTKQVDVSGATATDKILEIGHILMAIDNLYRRCSDGPPINHGKLFRQSSSDDLNIKSGEALEKLKIIKAYLDDFRNIVEDCPRNIINSCPSVKKIMRLISSNMVAEAPNNAYMNVI